MRFPFILVSAIVVLVLLPLLGVVGLAMDDGSGIWRHLRQTVLVDYVINSLVLTGGAALVAAVLGTGLGWLVAMTRFWGSRIWNWLLLLPLASPAYLLAYAWGGMLEGTGVPFRSLGGGVVLFGIAFYPYVYILARAMFLRQSGCLLDGARTLGLGPWRTFLRVTLPLARPAVVAGIALVIMETLADYGAVTYLGIPVFASGIYRAWFGFGAPEAAARLSLYLLVSVFMVLALERWARRQQAFYANPGRSEPPAPVRLQGIRAIMATVACAVPVLLGFGLPVVALMVRAVPELGGTDWELLVRLLFDTVGLAALATLLTLALALPLAVAVRLRPGALLAGVGGIACYGYAIPGGVIAIGTLHLIGGLDRLHDALPVLLLGSGFALVCGYAVRFLALAFGNLESAYTKIAPSLDAAGRTLGAGPLRLFARVHLPLLRPGLVAAGLLVFVEAVKELPMTIALHPFNTETLAVRVYNLASDERLGEAALPALLILLLSVLPAVFLYRRDQVS